MPDPANDERFMRHALNMARAGIGLASPNPNVGAVVVTDQGEVVGVGTHTYDGVKHAEILALEQAGEKARGATLYVNLEPCSHHGRTGPCADALISAGIHRVVAAMQDPNPQVSGKGFARLRDAGVVAEVGAMEEEARRLNDAFAKFIRTRTPLVTLKSAMSLDGKIAGPMGTPREWITGEAARAHVQELRHQHDAILIGVGTVIADDPLLTDRSGGLRRRPLLRVVLDSKSRIPLDSQIVQSAQNDVLVFYADAAASRKQKLEKQGIRLEQVASDLDGRPDLAAVLRRLGELHITSLIIEGGSSVNAAALSVGVVDKLLFYYAAKILGGHSTVPFANGLSLPATIEAPLAQSVRMHRFGDDLAIETYMRDPYAS